MDRQDEMQRTNKVEYWQTERKEQPCPIKDKGKSNLNPRMQSDKGTYILTGQTLSQNFQENQKRSRGTSTMFK